MVACHDLKKGTFMNRYDVAIVGSGAGGGAVAYSLAKAGYNVVLIEKGNLLNRDNFSKDEIAYCRRDIVTPKLEDEYHVIEMKEGSKWVSTPSYKTDVSFWNGNIVGGSSNFMTGMFHRLHPDDFRLLQKYGPIEGANIVDWPIEYEDLAPYYDLVEEIVGISGSYRPHPFNPPRKNKEYRQNATKENEVVKLFDNSCQHLNIVPLVTPRAVLSEDKLHRKACSYSNFCGHYGCSTGAKGSAREAFIIPALATGNLTLRANTHVKKLLSTKEKVSTAVVINTISGKESYIEADIFVVTAQAHESVRLLLNSANSYYPKGLANTSLNVGKNILFSGGGVGSGELYAERLKEMTFSSLMQEGLFINRSILDWYFMKEGEKGQYKGGLVEFMFEHQNIIASASVCCEEEGKLVWGRTYAESLVKKFKTQKTIRFEVFNDWLPTDDCFIGIDTKHVDKYTMPVGKIRVSGHPQDIKVGNILAKKCENILFEMGAKNIHSSVNSLPASNLIAGGCRFGDDPKTSVLNKYCQAHDLSNLYVADASFMPTGGSVPYTWTIYANALRVADHIIESLQGLQNT
jgi:choline dehydrogenase-like flavoprotein